MYKFLTPFPIVLMSAFPLAAQEAGKFKDEACVKEAIINGFPQHRHEIFVNEMDKSEIFEDLDGENPSKDFEVEAAKITGFESLITGHLEAFSIVELEGTNLPFYNIFTSISHDTQTMGFFDENGLLVNAFSIALSEQANTEIAVSKYNSVLDNFLTCQNG